MTAGAGAVLLLLAVLSASGTACIATTQRGGELEPRYVTVHNALSAMGMAEIGALHNGRLAEGQEAKIELELAPGCTTLVAIGSGAIADLDASLVNGAGTRVARGSAHASEATIRTCLPTAGSYTLVVKSARGAGDFIVSTWAGGAPSEVLGPQGRTGEPTAAAGTCDAPFALSAGDFTGSTARGESLNEAKGCPSTGAKLVYKLDIATRQKVTILVEAMRFDSVLYMRKADCVDADAEVACNDDAPDNKHSRIEEVVDAGTYYVFVDGYNNGAGAFKMHVDLSDVPALAEVCQKAALLAEGTPIDGSTEGTFDEANASCGEDARGPDTVYSFEVQKRSRVRLLEQSDDFAPVVHVRAQCLDPASAVGCSDSGGADHEATFVGLLDAGTYAVFADSSKRDASGKFTLSAETAPELGSGTRGERCGDAIVLSKNEQTVVGDTFAARDDVAGKCGGTGAPDVVYRLDVTARTHFAAHISREEGTHVLVLMSGCTGPKTELACGKAATPQLASVDRLLSPGTYFLAVDGDSPASFGKFTFEWTAHDTVAVDAACHAPIVLHEAHLVSGTTAGGSDKFSPSCSAHEDTGGAPDVVYKLVIPTHQRIRVDLNTSGWGSLLALRKSCVDSIDAAAPSGQSAGEIECRAEDSQGVQLDATLDPGTYFVVVDGREPGSAGAFTLQYHVVH